MGKKGGKEQRRHLALSSSLTRNLAECDLADSCLSRCAILRFNRFRPMGKKQMGCPEDAAAPAAGARAKCARLLRNDDVVVCSRRWQPTLHIACCRGGKEGEGTPGGEGTLSYPRHLCTLLGVSLERELRMERLFLVRLSQRHFVILSLCLWDCLWHCSM